MADMEPVGAPRIADHDPAWPGIADRILHEVDRAFASLPDHSLFVYDHIGSTAVPGLAAKPIVDLMVRVPALPTEADTAAALAPLGLRRARGSRPDSPGVDADVPRPGADPDPALYAKQLFHRPPTPVSPEVILHVRRLDSPFAEFVLDFRDWLRAEPDAAARYAALKRTLAADFAEAPDYDDYTRAKSDFMDGALREIERRRIGPGHRGA